MKQYIIILCLFIGILSAKTEHRLPEYSFALKLFATIDDTAIKIGKGTQTVYVFIDPMCRYSRKFMKMLIANEKMLRKYKYHLFLYEIPRLHSKRTIAYIYHQKDQLQSLLEIMLNNKKPSSLKYDYDKEKEIIDRIADIAKRLDVYKRPYIIISQMRQ